MMAVGQRNLDLRLRYLRLNDRRIDDGRCGCGDHLHRQNDAVQSSINGGLKRGSRNHLKIKFAFIA